MAREICKNCGRINPLGFCVSNHVWQLSVPSHLAQSVLCIMCFAQFADENNIAWDANILFYPVSKVSHDQFLYK